jgi:membrane protease YdiL (CAAX protease family)
MDMRPLRAVFLYLIFVFMGGAILAPALHSIVQWAAGHWPAWQGLAGQRFDRFVTRSMMVLALVGIWPFLRALGGRSAAELGWVKPCRGEGLNFFKGFLLGFISLALAAVALMARGAASQSGAADIGRHLLNAGVSAIVVAVLEETLFRGGIMGGLRRVYGVWPALVMSSAIYAAVHFFGRAAATVDVHWYSGFVVFGQMLGGFTDLRALFPKFICLILAGGMLGWVYVRTGSLYAPVGLHAGWIFWLKSYRHFFGGTAGGGDWFWGSRELVDGVMAVILLAACLPIIPYLFSVSSQTKEQKTC